LERHQRVIDTLVLILEIRYHGSLLRVRGWRWPGRGKPNAPARTPPFAACNRCRVRSSCTQPHVVLRWAGRGVRTARELGRDAGAAYTDRSSPMPQAGRRGPAWTGLVQESRVGGPCAAGPLGAGRV